MKAELSRLHWVKWCVLYDTVTRSAVLINSYNFIHEPFMAFLHTERQSLVITERSSQVCFVCRRSHVQVSDQKPVALTEASCGFSQSLLHLMSGHDHFLPNPSH